MTLPRQVLPGSFYFITRRCTQRQFLLRPDNDTNNAFIYCLAEAAQRYNIVVLLPCAMSNHYHAPIYDPDGRVSEFVEHLNKLLAKCQNVLRGRSENFWSSKPVSIVRLATAQDVVDKMVYTATNPVSDHLVDRAHLWPGVNGLCALLNQRPLVARRPYYFFRKEGPMPDTVTLTLTIPPELGDRDAVLREVRERVEQIEEEKAAERAKTGMRIVGRARVRNQHWSSSPDSEEPRCDLRPRVASRWKWARDEAKNRDRAFVAAYKHARSAWLAGAPIPFPAGTYWLRRFAGVPVATAATKAVLSVGDSASSTAGAAAVA